VDGGREEPTPIIFYQLKINDMGHYIINITKEDNDFGGISCYGYFDGGGIGWEVTESEIESGRQHFPKYLIVTSIGSKIKGAGKLAIKSLFDMYPSVDYLSYDDMSEGFWIHIGGDEYECLSRDNFFKYLNTSLTK
jgi:hypothetical protein